MKKELLADWIILIMAIAGIVLIFTSSETNLVTPALGMFASLMGFIYLKKFGGEFISTIIGKISSLKIKYEFNESPTSKLVGIRS